MQVGSIILLSLGMISCNSYSSDIDSVRIYYLPEDMLVPADIEDPREFLYHPEVLRDTIVRNKKFLYDLQIQMESLTPLEDSTIPMDLRIHILIRYETDSMKYLSMGQGFGTLLDSVRMKDNPCLYELIKNVIYK